MKKAIISSGLMLLEVMLAYVITFQVLAWISCEHFLDRLHYWFTAGFLFVYFGRRTFLKRWSAYNE